MKKEWLSVMVVSLCMTGAVWAASPIENTTYPLQNDQVKVQHYQIDNIWVKGENQKATKKIQEDLNKIEKKWAVKLEDESMSGGTLNLKRVEESSPYLSVEIWDSWYRTGAAHGMSDIIGRVYDVKTGERKKVQDFVKLDVARLDELLKDKTLKITMANNEPLPMEYGDDEIWKVKYIPDNFFLTKDGSLVLLYQVYELGPFAVGPTYIVIPKEIQAELNE